MTHQQTIPAIDPRPMTAGASFLMAGGGTGGHVIPSLAVARELRSRGHKVFFVGTEHGMEARLVPPKASSSRPSKSAA